MHIKELIQNGYCTTDQEYLFALGYAMQQINNNIVVNKTVKDHNIKRLLTANNKEELHEQFMLVYKKYFISIPESLNSLFALVVTYNLEQDINKDTITQGYLYTA